MKCKEMLRNGNRCKFEECLDGYCTPHYCLANGLKKRGDTRVRVSRRMYDLDGNGGITTMVKGS